MLATIGTHNNGLNYNHFSKLFLMKTDLNGDTLWMRSVGATGFDHYAMDLLPHSDGGYVMSGYTWGDLPGAISSSVFLFKADPLGNFPCMQQTHAVQTLDLFPADSSFTLTSVDGVFEQPAFMVDTIFPYATYDACIVTTVPDNLQPRKFKVYPNPTPGHFTIEFADPLLAESYYSVYDTMGRLLYQRPLPTGTTLEEVDLSRYGRGTYVIKITDRECVRA